MARRLSPALLVALLAPGPAAADVFTLKNGTTVDGYEAGRTKRNEVIIGTAKAVRTIAATAIVEVTPSADPASDFERYFAALGKKEADGAAGLGTWAAARGIPDAAKRAFEKALEGNPDQARAREGLGYAKVDGQWLTPAEVERRKADEAAREAWAGALEKALGVPPEVLLTPHWRYANLLGDGKAADRAKDLETAFAEAAGILGGDPWKDRATAVACAGSEQYGKWIETEGRRLPGMRGPLMDGVKKATGLKWHEPPVLARSDVPSIAAMHAAFLHTSGHLAVNLWNGYDRENPLPFWVEEGFGGWMEDRVLGSRSSFCFGTRVKTGYGDLARGSKAWDVTDPDWKSLIRQTAQRNEFLPLEQMDALQSGEYSPREVGQAFSFVAFLLKEKEPARFRDYVARVKGGAKSPVAFKQAYGETLEGTEPAWKAFATSGM